MLFDIAVGADPFPHQFGAADFEVAEIVGVIDDAAGVGVAVEDAAGGSDGYVLCFVIHGVDHYSGRAVFQ